VQVLLLLNHNGLVPAKLAEVHHVMDLSRIQVLQATVDGSVP
jgi:hypothetical protein